MSQNSPAKSATAYPTTTGAWHPNCPTLSKEHTTWLNENAMIGYAQAVAEAQAQSTGTRV